MSAVAAARSNDAAALEALCAAGAVKVAVKAVPALAREKPDASIGALELLTNLAATVPGAVKAAAAGAVELALRTIAASGDDDAADVAGLAMHFLGNLVVVEPAVARLAACDGGVAAILAALRRPRGSWKLHAGAARVLANFCTRRGAQAAAACIAAGSFQALAEAMARHAGVPAVQSGACQAICQLASALPEQAFPAAAVTAGCVERSAAALKAHASDADVQVAALSWLSSAARTRSYAQRIAAARIPLAACAALRAHSDNAGIFAPACALISSVTDHAEAPWAAAAAAEVLAQDLLGLALTAMGRFPGDADVQCEALNFAVSAHVLHRAPAVLAAATAWEGAALAAMRAHSSDGGVQHSGAQLVYVMAEASPALAAAAVRAGAVDALLDAARRHEGAVLVAKHCHFSLAMLASQHLAAAGAIAAGGGPDLAVAALVRHSDLSAVVSAAAGCLCALLRVQPDLAGRVRRVGAAEGIPLRPAHHLLGSAHASPRPALRAGHVALLRLPPWVRRAAVRRTMSGAHWASV